MKKISIRNKIPPLSSYLKKNKIDSFSTKKMSEARSYKNSEYTKNASIDYGDLHYNNKFNMIRKISKSSHMEQRLGDLSKFKNNIRSSENIYKEMNFRNVPPFQKNLSEIRRMIKRKKYKNIKLLDVMFFNSGLSNDILMILVNFKKSIFKKKQKYLKLDQFKEIIVVKNYLMFQKN